MLANLHIIGENIRKLRTAKKLSQQRLAELAGISYKYLGEIERGQSNVSVEILFQIASGMDVTASTLLKIENFDKHSELIRNIELMIPMLDENHLEMLTAVISAFLLKQKGQGN